VVLGAIVAAPVYWSLARGDGPKPADKPAAEKAAAEKAAAEKADAAKETRPEDRAALVKAADVFAEAFNRGDAKAVAALWTEDGENHGEGADPIHGRADIEKAYAKFFKENPKAVLKVERQGLRFHGRDLATEDGLMRLKVSGEAKEEVTKYTSTLVREGG